jgi:hypothetical protein
MTKESAMVRADLVIKEIETEMEEASQLDKPEADKKEE